MFPRCLAHFLKDHFLNAQNANSALWTMEYKIGGITVAGGPRLSTDAGGSGNYGNINHVGFSQNNAPGTISNFSLTAIPEPSSLALLGLGGLLIGARRRRG